MVDINGLSKKDIQEEYEDLVFRKVMAIYVQKEGKQILSELKEEKEHDSTVIDTHKIEKLYDKKERKENWKFILKYSKKALSVAAMVVFVAVISLSSVVVASADVRKALADAIYHLAYEDYDRYTEIKLGETTGFIDGEQFNWEGAYAPTYVPEGYVFTKAVGHKGNHFADFSNGETYITFSQSTNSTTQIDSEDAIINESILIGDSKGLLVVKDDTTYVLWNIGDTVLQIFGTADTEEIIKMAESIRLKQ